MRRAGSSIPIKKEFFIGLKTGNEQITDKYSVLREIGKGGYGRVYELENKITHKIVACKVYIKSQTKEMFEKEKELLQHLDHPNIIKIYDIYEDPHYYYLIMEKCKGGELFDKIIEIVNKGQIYSEKYAVSALKQILLGIAYCHANGICHRDLKPENLLLVDNNINSNIKIIDFGLSLDYSKIDNEFMTRKAGTCYYIAPEVLSGKYNEKCDIWSCGVILYILLCGEPPFNGKTEKQILMKIRKGTYSFSNNKWCNISPEAIDLIKHMICPQNERYSALEALQHPWLNKTEINEGKFLNFDIQTFTNYVNTSKLKRMSLLFIASRLNEKEIEDIRNSMQQMNSSENGLDLLKIKEELNKYDELEEIQKAFNEFDTNKDGTISYDELKQGLSIYGIMDEQILNLFSKIDLDKNNRIDYTEFIASLLIIRKNIVMLNLAETFVTLNVSQTGKISKQDLMTVLRVEESSPNIIEIENIIKDADKNKDGCIDYKEFMELFDQ